MFGLILFIVVVVIIGGLFSRPFTSYHRPWYYPFGVFGGWGMGHRHHHHPMFHGHHHHHHMGHGPMGHGPMGRGRRW
jgi:hypothetical protein